MPGSDHVWRRRIKPPTRGGYRYGQNWVNHTLNELQQPMHIEDDGMCDIRADGWPMESAQACERGRVCYGHADAERIERAKRLERMVAG